MSCATDDPRRTALDPWQPLAAYVRCKLDALAEAHDSVRAGQRKCNGCLKLFSGRGASAYCEGCGDPRIVNHTPVGARVGGCCHRGHPLSGSNVYLRDDGRRQCRTCNRENRIVSEHARLARAAQDARG